VLAKELFFKKIVVKGDPKVVEALHKEINAQREVVISMMLKFLHHSEVQQYLVWILIKAKVDPAIDQVTDENEIHQQLLQSMRDEHQLQHVLIRFISKNILLESKNFESVIGLYWTLLEDDAVIECSEMITSIQEHVLMKDEKFVNDYRRPRQLGAAQMDQQENVFSPRNHRQRGYNLAPAHCVLALPLGCGSRSVDGRTPTTSDHHQQVSWVQPDFRAECLHPRLVVPFRVALQDQHDDGWHERRDEAHEKLHRQLHQQERNRVRKVKLLLCTNKTAAGQCFSSLQQHFLPEARQTRLDVEFLRNGNDVEVRLGLRSPWRLGHFCQQHSEAHKRLGIFLSHPQCEFPVRSFEIISLNFIKFLAGPRTSRDSVSCQQAVP
jgi:hypothetical protein